MDRLDGLLGSKRGPKDGKPNSRGPSREPKVNFNDHQRRRTYGSTRGRGSSSGYATRGNRTWARTVELSSTESRAPVEVQRRTDRPLTKDRRKSHMRLGEVIPVTGDM